VPAKLEPRVASLERRAAQHDKEIAAIRKLIHTGMKLVVEVQRAQKRTEQSIDRLIRSLERGRPANGHTKGRRIQ
jgi:uncharacterized coiled-coil protein SlyX